MTFRDALARRSAAPLLYLRSLPRLTVPLVTIAVAVGGVLIDGPLGGALFLLIALFLTWLVVLSWPALDGAGKLVRVATIALIVAVAASRFG